MENLIRLYQWLRERWPRHEPRIVAGPSFVKVYQGNMLATNRPTLKQAMDRIRKYCPKPKALRS